MYASPFFVAIKKGPEAPDLVRSWAGFPLGATLITGNKIRRYYFAAAYTRQPADDAFFFRPIALFAQSQMTSFSL